MAIPKIWRRANVIALLKPNKPEDNPNSYRPISLLCVPYKVMERLLLGRHDPVVESQLPQQQAGFRRGRSTVQQVLKLTDNIEDCFEQKQKAGVVLVDLTGCLWHRVAARPNPQTSSDDP